jgi:glutathione synthase/RimK-type ligase-like ATP-grasp enzyme
MKIAIGRTTRNHCFTNLWIEYCQNNNIDFKLVDIYANNIIDQVSDCTGFMWHHSHADYRDALFSKQLIYSIEAKGIKVFPNFETTWHFDDKVGQKYLLEAIKAPFVKTYVFYMEADALDWIDTTIFPKVFKLRGGAGSANVKLIIKKKQAVKLVRKAFGKGFHQFDRFENLRVRYLKWRTDKRMLTGLLKGIGRLFIEPEFSKVRSREKGYVYFQDYIPNNSCDIRIVVVDDKAFGLKRLVRRNDFRASGSGDILYDKMQIDERCVEIAFEVNKKIKSQSIAFDFVFDQNNNPLILEISYGFTAQAYEQCEGYWDQKMNWHQGKNFNFCAWMVNQVL